MSNNTGKPAFPIVADSLTYICDPGMTLRDYFAAKAMQGMCAWGAYEERRDVAKEAYEIADAMLKAREENAD